MILKKKQMRDTLGLMATELDAMKDSLQEDKYYTLYAQMPSQLWMSSFSSKINPWNSGIFHFF